MFTLVGTALYISLLVYTGLSLFIIRRANVYLVVCVLTRITLQRVGLTHPFIELSCVHVWQVPVILVPARYQGQYKWWPWGPPFALTVGSGCDWFRKPKWGVQSP